MHSLLDVLLGIADINLSCCQAGRFVHDNFGPAVAVVWAFAFASTVTGEFGEINGSDTLVELGVQISLKEFT